MLTEPGTHDPSAAVPTVKGRVPVAEKPWGGLGVLDGQSGPDEDQAPRETYLIC